jgi:hypothetical protein
MKQRQKYSIENGRKGEGENYKMVEGTRRKECRERYVNRDQI